MTINEITGAIITASMKVHTALGPGLLESAYEACVAYELQKMGLRVERQKPIPVVYEGVKLDCGFRADLLVEGQVIAELKAKDSLHPIDEAQLLSHLRLLNLQVGLLINFHVVSLKDGIKRLVNRYQGPSPRNSVHSAVKKPTAECAELGGVGG
jgi:GxxExxY protein